MRKYLPREVPSDLLVELVDCARLAPSGWNKQPWTFVVVTDRALLASIAATAVYGRFIAEAAACVAIFCAESGTKLEDASAAAENLMVAAASRGLGSCWVNSYRKEHSAAVEALLGCPPETELVVLVSLGYPDDSSRRDKKSLAEVLRWNQF